MPSNKNFLGSPILISVLISVCFFVTAETLAQSYQPNLPSLVEHETPEWFRDAKLGIFIHWGVYSVPAWAERGEYAEWYPYRMQQEGSPTHEYHLETYGEDFAYEDFVPMWKAENWDPEEWADLFHKAGARYVVPVGEHHDGFPLWDSELTDWNAAQMGPERDLIGDLGESVRARGMKYAPSYHGLLNYYEPGHGGPHPDYMSEDYVTFMHDKLRELIDNYQPDLLWLDGDWMESLETFDTMEIIAYYYNQEAAWDKEVAANDRWGQVRGILGDFYTQEYEYDVIDRLIDHKWENTRGVGNSFGHNSNEPIEDFMSVTEVVHLLVDNVSKNANLLLNVGPRADGTIPEAQINILLGLGDWLEVNGDGIYDTRPWITAEGSVSISAGEHSDSQPEVRFTWKEQDNSVYAFFLSPEEDAGGLRGEATLHSVMPDDDAEIRVLGSGEALEWHRSDNDLVVTLPEQWPAGHARGIRITPEPGYMMKFP